MHLLNTLLKAICDSLAPALTLTVTKFSILMHAVFFFISVAKFKNLQTLKFTNNKLSPHNSLHVGVQDQGFKSPKETKVEIR